MHPRRICFLALIWISATAVSAMGRAAEPPAATLPKDLGTRKAGDDWPDFLGPNRDAQCAERGILTDWSGDKLRVVWQRELAEGYPGPVISRGRLFQFDQDNGKARLVALRSETGKELWKFEYRSDYADMLGYDNGPRACPVVDGDRVYIYGAEGMLHCLRAEDGKVVWKVDTVADFGVVQNFFGVGSVPIVEGDLLIAQVGGSPAGSPETYSGLVQGNGSGIVAFDKLTGKMKYKLTDELASYSSPIVRTIGGRKYCFVFARGGLVAFDPASGKLDFEYPWRSKKLESVNASNPVCVDDFVLVSECYSTGASLLKLKSKPDAAAGADGDEAKRFEVVWKDGIKRNQSLATHWNTPVYHDGYVYASSGRNTSDADLVCVEFKTGKVQWKQPRLTRSSLLYIDGHFICLTEEGVLRLIKANPKKFEEVTQTTLSDGGEPRLEYPAWAAPVVSHGLLYVRGKNRLVCTELIPEKK